MGVFSKVKKRPEQLQSIESLYEYFRKPLGKQFLKTSITPNQVTFTTLVIGIIAAIFYSIGSHLYLILGAIFTQVCIQLDFIDGYIAREKGLSSKTGGIFDTTIATLCDTIILFGIVIGIYSSANQLDVWIWGSIAITGRLLIKGHIYLLLTTPFAKELINEGKKQKLLKNIIYSRTTIHLLACIGALFDRMYWFIILISVYGIIFYTIFLIISVKKISYHEKNFNKGVGKSKIES